jgi:cobalt/nickel transport system ATP-binding protein
VSFAYRPDEWAIQDLNVQLDAPSRICLLGANGVGKSTLMMLLNGTLRPQQGNISVLGEPIDYSKTGLHKLHRQIGVVLQDPDDQLFGATVEQDVAFGPLNNGISSGAARTLVHETLDELGIPYLADRPIHELSLGEKKRVALAGVLVLQPKLILLDEPTAGLDFAGITAMVNILNKVFQSGTTLIISTHDTDLAYEWADDAWVLMNGRVAAQGPMQEVLRDRTMLQEAHLKLPLLLELGVALQEASRELDNLPLPKNRDELLRQIRKQVCTPSSGKFDRK